MAIHWSGLDDYTLLSLRDEGKTYEDIATTLGRTTSSVKHRAHRLSPHPPKPAQTQPAAAPKPRHNIRTIITCVAQEFGVRREDILGQSRAKKFCLARFMAMHLVREMTPRTYPAIGAFFGGRDHSTTVKGCRIARDRLAASDELRERVSRVMDAIVARDAAAVAPDVSWLVRQTERMPA